VEGPEAKPDLLVTPGHAGQPPLNKQTNGWWGIGSISAEAAKDDKKLDELLRVLDFWAAPFGSEEYTFLTYGIEGRHYTLDDRGNPIPTSDEKVISELNGNYFINPSETTLYYPGTTDRAKLAHDYFEKQLEGSIADPSLGLVSQTNIKKVSSLGQMNTSYENDIVSGRKPLSALKEWRSRWKSQGGETIRKEYEESLQRSKSKK
jgi:putative aldouronate transport system substrate-binding protein